MVHRYDLCLWVSSKYLEINRSRLLKASNITVKYPSARGPRTSPEKLTAVCLVTRQCPSKDFIYINETPISYVLTSNGLKKKQKKTTDFFSKMIRMISGTIWGCSVFALLTFYNLLFVELLRHSLPVMHTASKTAMKNFESAQAQALRTHLGLPKCTYNTSRITEAR